jgi:DNA-3-methyladenine glycosylase
MSRRLPRSFYERPTLTVLQELIGKVLVHDVRGVRTSGAIVEAEAYIGEDDPACHAAPGPTRRNAPLYGTPAAPTCISTTAFTTW